MHPSDEHRRNAESCLNLAKGKQRPVWQTIATAPLNREIEVAVLDEIGYDVFAFWVRRTEAGWVANRIDGFLSIAPTHWRERADND